MGVVLDSVSKSGSNARACDYDELDRQQVPQSLAQQRTNISSVVVSTPFI